MDKERGSSEEIQALIKLLTNITDENEMKAFLDDLCTYKEIEQMAIRLDAACMLSENSTYTEVIKKVDISSATLSRVSRCVKYSKGYKQVIKNHNLTSSSKK